MKNLKIKFSVDVKGKVVTIYFNEIEFEEWVKRAIDDHPKLTTKELSHAGSDYITYTFSKAFQKICRMAELDMDEFKAEPKMYKHQTQLPIQLREMNL